MKVVAVIGCGRMGCLIAVELAYHGHTVRMYDIKSESIDHACIKVDEERQALVHDKAILEHFAGRVFFMGSLQHAVSCAQIVIECIPDKIHLKKQMFKALAEYCDSSTIIVSSSMNIKVTDIVGSDDSLVPGRTMGLRFLYPVRYIKEVEITPHMYTTLHTQEEVKNFLHDMDKEPFLRMGAPISLTLAEVKKRQSDFKHQLLASHSDQASVTFSEADSGYSSASGMLSECVYCVVRDPNCLLKPCNHLVTCVECTKLMKDGKECCPACRKPITGYTQIKFSYQRTSMVE